MAYQDILNYIYTKLANIPSIGIVLPYRPIATTPEGLVPIFGGSQTVKAWAVTPAEKDATIPVWDTNREKNLTHKVSLDLYFSVTDPAVSQPAAVALSELAMTEFGNLIQTVAPSNIERSEPLHRVGVLHVTLGSGGAVLCHYIPHELTVYERVVL